jgi:hypothetical protein
MLMVVFGLVIDGRGHRLVSALLPFQILLLLLQLLIVLQIEVFELSPQLFVLRLSLFKP